MAKRKQETFEEVFTKNGLIPEWIERGRVQGREEGRAEGIAQVTKRMKAMGFSNEQIQSVTGNR